MTEHLLRSDLVRAAAGFRRTRRGYDVGERRMRSTDLLDNEHASRIAFGFHDGVTVLGLVGAHDLSNSERLRVAIDHECAHDRGVVVSFTAADFIDSSVLFGLLKADRRLQAHGRRLVLHTNPTMTCGRIVSLVTTRDALPCRERLEHAIALASLRSDGRVEAVVPRRPPSEPERPARDLNLEGFLRARLLRCGCPRRDTWSPFPRWTLPGAPRT